MDWYFSSLLSRLDDQQNGAIVLVMQRLHEDDLAGVVLRGSDEWTVLSLPAIADQDEEIPIGNGRRFISAAPATCCTRSVNQERNWRRLRAQLPPEIDSAQYQQQPVAPAAP